MHQINHKFYFVIFLSLFFHIIASFYSIGWLNADEQSCILEYLNLKLGYNANPCFLNYVDGNAIDSSVKIRSWSQPFLYYLLSKIFIFFNIHDFFILTFLLKLFSSLIGWLSIIFFYLVTKNQFKNEIVKNFYLLLIFLFWFYPLLHARTSAENLSISFLLIGMSFYLYFRDNIKVYKILILGLIFGLSFVFRYNLIFSIIFFYLWIIIFENKDYIFKIKILVYSFLSGTLILFLELIVNIWGFNNRLNLNNLINYDFIINNSPFFQFLFYFQGNNFYSGSDWSGHNFFSYIEIIALKFYPPLSLLILVCLFYLIIKNFRNLIVWIILPYLLVHSYFSHKELRYVFPVLAFSPYLICYFLENSIIREKFKKILINSILILNFMGLIYVSFSNLRPELKVLNTIYKQYVSKLYFVNYDDSIKFYESLNPYEIDNITDNYYFKFVDVEIIKKINDVSSKIGSCKSPTYGRGICLKKNIEDYKKNIISFNFLKSTNNKIHNMEMGLINLSKNYNINNFMKDYLDDNELFILTQDHKVINQLNTTYKCMILKNAKPVIISRIKFNKINERIENLIYFKCIK